MIMANLIIAWLCSVEVELSATQYDDEPDRCARKIVLHLRLTVVNDKMKLSEISSELKKIFSTVTSALCYVCILNNFLQ